LVSSNDRDVHLARWGDFEPQIHTDESGYYRICVCLRFETHKNPQGCLVITCQKQPKPAVPKTTFYDTLKF
ncbi:MAG: hypothetical protein K8R19_05635, partial [Methanosarcinales archaeon]|nr:hypothetical protein [Methanosarcinales archaeon]